MSDSIFRIWSIARYEAKVIMRGWTFRIALLINLAALIVAYFVRSFFWKVFSPGMFEIPSSFPYISILYSNVLISLTGAFIAADSISRIRTLDSNEAVFSRNFYVLEFAIGRSAGLLSAFALQTTLVCAVILVNNLVFTSAEVELEAYLIYLFLICIPSFVFFAGFAMVMQSAIGNRALTMMAILGAAAFFLLFVSNRFFYVFDIFSFRMPMLLSLYTGLDGATAAVAQRMAWLLVGAAMSGAAFLMLRRPRQSRLVSAVMTGSVPFFIVISVLLLGSYVRGFTSGINMRARMVILAKDLGSEPLATPESFVIDIVHDGDEIGVSANVALLNNNQVALEKYFFNLNPGLEVLSVESSGAPLVIRRDLQILEIDPDEALRPGERDTVNISCRGTIDDRACFPDADESTRWRGFNPAVDWGHENDAIRFRYSAFNFRRSHSWTDPDLLLLPPHSMWYPVPGVIRGSQDPALEYIFFADYTLNVVTRDGLEAVSQGRIERTGPGRFRIVAVERLLGITLAVGRYSTRSIDVDGIEYSLSTLCPDDYFLPYFESLADTLPMLIREMKDWIDLRVGMDYPLSRLAIIEVPANFNCLPRPLVTNGMEYSQPGLILAPERGFRWDTTIFALLRNREGSFRDWYGRDPEVVKASYFVNMIRHSLMVNRIYFPISSWYSGIFHIDLDDCPVLDHSFESYYAERMSWSLDINSPFDPGTGRIARTIISLDGTSLSDLVADPARREEAVDALPLKGKQLFLEMESFVGEREMEEFLGDFITKNRGRSVPGEEFYSSFEEKLGIDVRPLVERWYSGDKLSGFSLKDLQWYGIRKDGVERGQVRLKAFNREKVAGLIRIIVNPVRTRGGGRSDSKMSEAIQKIFRLEPGEAKELGIVTDFRPRSIYVNTLISRNLPASRLEYVKNQKYIYRDNAIILDGSRPLDPSRFGAPDAGVVVDNTDPGFEIVSDPEGSLLSRIIGSRRRSSSSCRYIKYHQKKPPAIWRETVQKLCYGRYVRSGHYVTAGSGTGRVRWTIEIPENGTYEVYHHMVDTWHSMKPEHRKNVSVQEYHFSISHDEGTDDWVLVMHEHPTGWNLLGTYYFTKGKATVELTDESPKLFVIADAVKWVKKD